MQKLNLPAYPFHRQQVKGKEMIFDPVRQKYVRLTPEEWVRQHFVQFLIHEQGVPQALVAIEKAFLYQGMTRRADIVIHDRQGQPLMMVECKAPEVTVQQEVFDQIARYNKVVQAQYLVVTNGMVHYCYQPDPETHTFRFFDFLPSYDAL